jgi:hypothetical protein
MNPIRQLAVNLIWERPARKRDVAGHAKQLEQSGIELQQRLAASADSARNRKVLNHIVGIERWSQSRLRVTLGEPYLNDEYDGYRPAREATWQTLKEQFHQTRAETVSIAQEIGERGIDQSTTVNHNSYGPLSVRGWLRYMNLHANFEAKKIK